MTLKQVGQRWTGLCPFHAEKSPSFSLNAEEKLYYCLAGETRVLTWNGVREIRDLAGTSQRILTQRGKWVDAPFKSFGTQRLWKVTVGRNGQYKDLYATAEHRWMLRNDRNGTLREQTTSALRKGHLLAHAFPRNRTRILRDLSPFGIAHGIAYGDGTQFGPAVALDLHGEKDAQLLKWFPLNQTYSIDQGDGKTFTKVLDLPNFFKERPSLNEATTYLAGWLAGYLAADGHVAKDGTVMINSADRTDLEFVRDVCTRLGIATYGVTEQRRAGFDGREESSLFRVHLVTSDLDERFFLVDEHRIRFNSCDKKFARRGWIVKSVEPTDRIEEVFCAEVDGTHNFALEDNILTGNCFGCQASGDVITFVRETEHLDFAGAVERLARAANIQLRYDDNAAAGQDRKKRDVLFSAMEKAVAWYHDRLLTDPAARPARDYLKERGYNSDIARQFSIGWAPDDWDQLARYLKLSDKELTDSGLGFVNRRGKQQDSFRGRIMFPIYDTGGKAVAFGGRILPGSEDPAKYKNSSETPIYSKRRVLYGLNWAKADAVSSGEVVVCEGYTDVIAFFLAGAPRAVATCGTAVTEEHLRALRTFAPRIVLAYDADAAGQAAAERFYTWERDLDLSLHVLALPKGADPADLARRDPAALRKALEGSRSFLDFRVQRGSTLGISPRLRVGRRQPKARSRWWPSTRTSCCAISTSARSPARVDIPAEQLMRSVSQRGQRVTVSAVAPRIHRHARRVRRPRH